MQMLASGILAQITSLLNLDDSAICCTESSFTAMEKKGRYVVLAATGEFVPYIDADVESIPDKKLVAMLSAAGPCGLSSSESGGGTYLQD